MTERKSNKDKKDLAKVLYMSGISQKEIAERVGVSANSVNKWVNLDGWQELRAAKNITRPELINKLLLSINSLLEKSNETKDDACLGDRLIKLANTLEKLDKKASFVNVVDVFSAFVNWLEIQHGVPESGVTLDFIKKVNSLQNNYTLSLVPTA